LGSDFKALLPQKRLLSEDLRDLPAQCGHRFGYFSALGLDNIHELPGCTIIYLRLFVRVDGLEVVDGVLDFLGLGGQIPRFAAQFFDFSGCSAKFVGNKWPYKRDNVKLI
jgi:hypothetical protein